jgi:hypothetical protein
MIILGLNAFHADSSAALVRDGKLIAAAEEERFCRIKHWAGFPSQAIAYCLSEAGIKLSDVDHIAFNHDSRANLMRKITYFITKRPNINLVLRRLRNRRSRAGIPHFLSKRSPAKLSARRPQQLLRRLRSPVGTRRPTTSGAPRAQGASDHHERRQGSRAAFGSWSASARPSPRHERRWRWLRHRRRRAAQTGIRLGPLAICRIEVATICACNAICSSNYGEWS